MFQQKKYNVGRWQGDYITVKVCVFLSSSEEVAAPHFKAAEALGSEIARRKWSLVYGGSNIGLMGAMARAACAEGGTVVGIIPSLLHSKVPKLEGGHELVVTTDLRERKTVMELRSDAFIALPGGFGTLEELLEILTLKQLKHHAKPVVILNVDGFYDKLLALFEQIFEQKFAKVKYRELYHVAGSVDEALRHIEQKLNG